MKHTVLAMAAFLMAATTHAASPGITSTDNNNTGTFLLTAQPANLNQPDGNAIYSWGYGCTSGGSGGTNATFVPAGIAGARCGTMQVPGPTLVVTEGQTVSVTLTNNLPTAAGNTSIMFPGIAVTSSGGVQGLLTQEAQPGGSVTYTFTAPTPGTRAYYSGTQSDLQVEMGLYGAIVVLPKSVPANCDAGLHATNLLAKKQWGESDFRLAHAAYDHPGTCYDREYLFQFAEMDANIHAQAQTQSLATAGCTAGAPGCSLMVPTEPYHPSYFLINGRSMPDDMDPNYAAEYPQQPYNGNPHMHPGELTLIRVIGQGRWEHPFHEHANHVRILARDANLLLTPDGQELAGLLMFTTDTFPGQSFDGIFYFTGRGLNWDMYGHNPTSTDPLAKLPCLPDANGYNTVGADKLAYTRVNYFEWCQDHNKPLEANPLGDVNSGGPMTLPNPNIFTNGAWYGGTPYLGPDATLRSDTTLNSVAVAATSTTAATTYGAASGCVTGVVGATDPTGTPNCSALQPSNVQANPANERGWAYMWHSHNEREITTNNVFPGGMFMMMLVDSREFVIDESK
ncbi:MAG TPA: multicopper oxidase family protein [Steroidobacteraceae bacterium]|nr:multicopper oxidase family protein [Steroidobacteraceae bacterium]